MKDREQTYVVEDWNDYQIRVRGDGTFFVKDDDGKVLLEGKSIDVIKRALSKSTPMDQWAFVQGWRYDHKGLEQVHIYARTGLGNLMYTRGTVKNRLRRGEHLLVLDQERAAQRTALLAEQTRVEKELRALMDAWPKVTA